MTNSIMEIKTKFSLGDKVWTIRDFKATEIEIDAMTVNINGVWIRGKEDYTSFHEDTCFATKVELIRHIAGDGNEGM